MRWLRRSLRVRPSIEMNSLTTSPTAPGLHCRTRRRKAMSVTPDIGASTSAGDPFTRPKERLRSEDTLRGYRSPRGAQTGPAPGGGPWADCSECRRRVDSTELCFVEAELSGGLPTGPPPAPAALEHRVLQAAR